jgi:hypothetical protein
MAEINLKQLTSGVSEIDVNFNGTLEGQADATIPLNVNLTDSLGDVTPTSVALTGNDLDIVIPDPAPAPSGVLFKTIEPSQYTSYRTGDEGWRVQNGWFDYTPPSNPAAIAELDYTSTTFFNVLKTPLVVNGVSSTTRFVDVNGIQAFSSTSNANLVVIDKLTGLMYTRISDVIYDWNGAIDAALSYSIVVVGNTYNDWYLNSDLESLSIYHRFAGVAPNIDTLTSVTLLSSRTFQWTSTTYPNSTTEAMYFKVSERTSLFLPKTTSIQGPTFVRNARNLITAP